MNKKEAIKTYNEYVRQSKGFGYSSRAYTEDVCLMINEEPEREFYFPSYMAEKLLVKVERLREKLKDAEYNLDQYRKHMEKNL